MITKWEIKTRLTYFGGTPGARSTRRVRYFSLARMPVGDGPLEHVIVTENYIYLRFFFSHFRLENVLERKMETNVREQTMNHNGSGSSHKVRNYLFSTFYTTKVPVPIGFQTVIINFTINLFIIIILLC